ncbi:MAG: ABC transporter substrate-binding protein [Rhodospirillales bacterium]|nr:ABC transporter substrate-binding protein [Rhodospirillales bacterium]
MHIVLPLMLVFGCAAVLPVPAFADPSYKEPPVLRELVAAGQLPPVGERVPSEPSVVEFSGIGQNPGHYGGAIRTIMGRAKDIRMMVVYGYARLVGYDRKYRLKADILRRLEVEEGRRFTLHLRKGHRWSDGHPFTAEDFRYFWEDVATDPDISPYGPDSHLLVEGKLPVFEVLDTYTVRYTWHKANPFFLPSLAAASPIFIYRPAHYLKHFHAKHEDAERLEMKVKKSRKQTWRALHFGHDRLYRFDLPEMPTLQPWMNTTPPPSERFVFKRNPYYHRVDGNGLQLPYVDEFILTIAGAKLIAAKAGSGEADLQARSLQFKNYTFLKRGEQRNDFTVHRWVTAKGAQMALYPNLNAADPVWSKLLRDVRFRRALSLAIDRHEINQVVYFGLGLEGGNTVLPKSPLFKPAYRSLWASYDIKKANALLDEIGLLERDSNGIRLLPDGNPVEIIVESAGEDSDQADVLQLIGDSWRKIGVKLFTKPTRREVLRRRALAGATTMSIWFGLENGIPTENSSPEELTPSRDDQLQWPKWGHYMLTDGQGGEPVDDPAAAKLVALNKAWIEASEDQVRENIWHEILQINAEQVFTIGITAGVPQPVVVNNALRNVPTNGVYNWDPGAHFGIYRPDTFWYETK